MKKGHFGLGVEFDVYSEGVLALLRRKVMSVGESPPSFTFLHGGSYSTCILSPPIHAASYKLKVLYGRNLDNHDQYCTQYNTVNTLYRPLLHLEY